jgi:hypothetical protein
MSVEKRQTKLAANTEATERWMRRLFRAATELKKLSQERKRLLSPSGKNRKYKPMEPIGIGSGAPDFDDEVTL